MEDLKERLQHTIVQLVATDVAARCGSTSGSWKVRFSAMRIRPDGQASHTEMNAQGAFNYAVKGRSHLFLARAATSSDSSRGSAMEFTSR